MQVPSFLQLGRGQDIVLIDVSEVLEPAGIADHGPELGFRRHAEDPRRGRA
jgi:hypothetical protein